jgi:hypothetical protein
MSHTDQVEHEHEGDEQCDVFVGALLGYTQLSDNQSRIANDVESSHHMPRNIPMLDERVRLAAEASKVLDEDVSCENRVIFSIQTQSLVAPIRNVLLTGKVIRVKNEHVHRLTLIRTKMKRALDVPIFVFASWNVPQYSFLRSSLATELCTGCYLVQ